MRMNQRQSSHADWAFGPFRLFLAQRRLEKDGVDIKLGSRALDILVSLVEGAGNVVTNEQLAARVWPGTTVEESGLRVHVAALRKALGDGKADIRYVGNVPGRGYYFSAPVSREGASRPSVPGLSVLEKRNHSLPPRLEGIVGREETIRSVGELLLALRFVSIVGPGGMGKTTVAVAIAYDLRDGFGGDVCFVDLAALTEPDQVASTIASAVGLGLTGGDAITSLVRFLQDRRALLVLDSCEHVLATLAPLVERVFADAPQVSVIATSREALRVQGEQVHRLQPLESPPSGADLTTETVLAFPAARLFVLRATHDGARPLTDSDAPVVAQICRGLDGIALAIEFAAARVEAYGIRGTASLLENRLKLLRHGRRTALPRHQTLSSLLDWSHSLLSENERTTLRRLSIFVGLFSLDAVTAVTVDSESHVVDALDALGSLIEKSLISIDNNGETVRYRLLDTTRHYAQGKLDEAGERDAVARRLAMYACRLLERDECSTEDLGNVRAALGWSFSVAGDVRLGAALAVASAPLFMRHALLIECHRWVDAALNALPVAERGTRREMELQATLGISAMFTRGNSEKVQAALERAVSMLEELDEPEQLLRMLGALDMFVTRVGEFREAQKTARRAEVVARRLADPHARAIAEWMIGTSCHLLGRQVEAERLCRSALDAPPMSRSMANGFGFSHRMRALVSLGRTLWLQGRAEEAMDVARATMHIARESGQPVNVAISLVWTSSVFLWSGDLDTAGDIIEQLGTFSAKYSLGPYSTVALGLKGELLVRRGAAQAGLGLLLPAMETLCQDRHDILQTVFASAIAEAFGLLGRFDEAIATLDRALESTLTRNGDAFDVPEMLRLEGQLLATMPAPMEDEAEERLERALDIAARQGALAWELRAATTLARLLLRRGRGEVAHERLRACYSRFSQGFETADLREAKRLISAADCASIHGADSLGRINSWAILPRLVEK
jgi:predicted ATPase/DNA-binding winged helix-turn-helix (wHTH) protein